jgi:AcrR family transcriptional regulator
MNMSVHAGARSRVLLDVAAEVLVADPSASLAEVAFAAGIGRTTLHKHFATRDDLIRAVGHRAIDLWEQAIDEVTARGGGLRAMAEALIPIGPQLAFLWRNPIFDHVEDIARRWAAVESRGLALVKQSAQAGGAIKAGVPDWWLLQTFNSLVYVAAESVQSGHLAPRDAPDLMLNTFLHGLGAAPAKGAAPTKGDRHE